MNRLDWMGMRPPERLVEIIDHFGTKLDIQRILTRDTSDLRLFGRDILPMTVFWSQYAIFAVGQFGECETGAPDRKPVGWFRHSMLLDRRHVGLLQYSMFRNPGTDEVVGCVSQLFVKEAFRNRGFGTGAVRAMCRRSSPGRLQCQADAVYGQVDADDAQAVRFASRFGHVVNKVLPYPDDERILFRLRQVGDWGLPKPAGNPVDTGTDPC